MQKALEKSCFEKNPTCSVFWRIRVSLGGLPSSLCTPTAQAARTRPPGLPPLPRETLAREMRPSLLASLDSDTSSDMLCWMPSTSPLILSGTKPDRAFVLPSDLIGVKGQSSGFDFVPRNSVWHSPCSSVLTAHSGSRTLASLVSSYFTDCFAVPLVGSSSSFSPPFLSRPESAVFSRWIGSFHFSHLHPWHSIA